MPIDPALDPQEESGSAPLSVVLDFKPEPTYLSQIAPVMRQVMQEWGVSLARPSANLSAESAETVNRTIARMVRKEAEARLQEGKVAKIFRGAQQAGVGLGQSFQDPTTVGLIALSAVQPEIGLPIFAAIGAKQIGETAGTLTAPGATVTPEETTERLISAGLMAAPIAGVTVKGVRNVRPGVREAAERTAERAAQAAEESAQAAKLRELAL